MLMVSSWHLCPHPSWACRNLFVSIKVEIEWKDCRPQARLSLAAVSQPCAQFIKSLVAWRGKEFTLWYSELPGRCSVSLPEDLS